MYPLRLLSPEAMLLLLAMVLAGCNKTPADVSSAQAQKRADYQLKTARLDQQEAVAKAAVHREVFEQKVQAWDDVAESQVRANAKLSPEAARRQDRDLATIRATKRLELLDARVTELRTRIEGTPASTRNALDSSLEELRPLRSDAVEAVSAIRDENLALDQTRKDADRRLHAFESAIDVVTKRVTRVSVHES